MLLERKEIYYYKADQTFSPSLFARQLAQMTASHQNVKGDYPILFLCIGSDRVLGDSLGPIVGYKLEQMLPSPFQVLGTLSKPVHAVNLKTTLLKLAISGRPPLLIAIDASIGRKENIGYITLSNQSIRPGTGVAKCLPRVGHISITGIVSEDTSSASAQLQNIRLGLVMNLADCICNGIKMFQELTKTEQLLKYV